MGRWFMVNWIVAEPACVRPCQLLKEIKRSCPVSPFGNGTRGKV